MLLGTDPDAATELLREVHATSTGALENPRSFVRSIHPPVLADRGLAGGIEALALLAHIFTKLDLPQASDDNRRVLAILAWLDGT